MRELGSKLMLLIVSDAGHRRKLRKLIFNLHRFLPFLALSNWNGLGMKKVLLDGRCSD